MVATSRHDAIWRSPVGVSSLSARLTGAALALAVAVFSGCESPEIGGLNVRNGTEETIRVVFLSPTPARTGEPIEPGLQVATGLAYGDNCSRWAPLEVINARGELIARTGSPCGLRTWVITTPTMAVRNQTGVVLSVGTRTAGLGSGVTVQPGDTEEVPVATDSHGCAAGVSYVAWGPTGEELATTEQPCLGDDWVVSLP